MSPRFPGVEFAGEINEREKKQNFWARQPLCCSRLALWPRDD
jgi:hypothetical protein